MKSKSFVRVILAFLLPWLVTTPAFGGMLLHSQKEMEGVQAGKGVPLTDAQLDAVTGGEALVCGSPDDAECLSPEKEGLRTTIKLWDDWVKRTQVEGGGASAGGLVQSNTTGTVQFNSTMSH